MKTWLIWVLVGFTILCTMGLAYVQVQWIYSAVSSERENFNNLIANVIYTVSEIIEEEDLLINIAHLERIEKPIIDNLQKFYKTKGDSVLISNKSYLDLLSQALPDSIRKGLAVFGGLPMTEQYALIKRMFSLLADVQTPIEERVSKGQVQRLLQSEFQRNNIDVPYEFAVTDDDKIVLQSDGYTAFPILENHSVKLFRNDSHATHNYLLTVHIPHKSSYVVRSITLLIYITLVLILTTITLFAIALITIFRQKRLSEIKADFISNITHELKTPISTISLAGQMLEDPSISDLSPRIPSLAKIMQRETKRLSSLVEKILELSLFEQRAVRLKKKEFNMHRMIERVLESFSLQFNKNSVEVLPDFKAKQVEVYGDELRLSEVVSNLIDNAIKYRKEHISLQIQVQTVNKGTEFELTILDNGIGVASEHLKRIFDKFYRVPNKNIHNIKGFGLGLNYAKEIIEMHGGHMWVRSELLEGSAFGFTIPAINKEN